MAENSKIEWTDHTFNPWTGCTKVSPGCDHCYAEGWAKRSGAVKWGAGEPRRRTTEANWKLPLKWNRQALAEGRRFKVFCASLADVFDNGVGPAWRADLLELIQQTPHLDWLLLTKRISNVRDMLPASFSEAAKPWSAWRNVRIGATIVNQEEWDRDIGKLLTLGVQNFVSIEPLLGPINMRGMRPDWVIVGGESGPGARPMHPDWARNLRDQCKAAGVPFLFKQWGEWCPRGPESWGYACVEGVPSVRLTDAGHNGQDLSSDGGNDVWMNRAGKKIAGRMLDGVTHDGYPVVRV